MDKNRKIKNALSEIKFENREKNIIHPTYDTEIAFYKDIQNGNLARANRYAKHVDFTIRGKLSENPIRNLRYHFITALVMISRFCIEGGMPEQDAYYLSHIYFNKLDTADTTDKLYEIQKEFKIDFARRMLALKKCKPYSKHTTCAIDYVYEHLHEKITLKDVASQVGLEPTSLSKLFSRETGTTLFSYINHQKIEAAKDLLLFSDYSISEIANLLSFASTSYFGKLFKEENLLSPSEYRKENYRHFFDK